MGRTHAGATVLAQAWERLVWLDPERAWRRLKRGAVVGGVVATLVEGARLTLGAGTGAGPEVALAVAAGALVLTVPWHRGWALATLVVATGLAPALGLPAGGLAFLYTLALGLHVAVEAQGWWRRTLALLGPSLGAAWFLLVVEALGARPEGPWRLTLWLAYAHVGVFVTLGALLAEVELAADAMVPRLRGAPRLLEVWERLRGALGRLPEGAARARLQALVEASATRWLGATQARRPLTEALASTSAQEARDAVLALTTRLETATDPALRAHLEQMARVHRDHLEQLDGLARQAQRLEAEAAAELTWLETAALSVELAPRAPPLLADVAARLEHLAPARG